MQAFVVVALAFVLTAGSASAGAAQVTAVSVPAGEATSLSEPKPIGEQSLDELFATLADPADETRGKAAEQEIMRRWSRSGSATIDLLMGWAQQSVAAKDYGRALDFLDSVVMLKPDYAEGWNRRATVFYLRDDYGKALSDLEKVLALEPRHFGALSGIGMIFRDIDRKADALAAFEKAVAIDPYLDSDVKDAIKTLAPDVHGKEI